MKIGDNAVECRTCEDTGRITVRYFDGWQSAPCPHCQHHNTERVRMAAEFGTDKQRREIATQRKAVAR